MVGSTRDEEKSGARRIVMMGCVSVLLFIGIVVVMIVTVDKKGRYRNE